jgi:ubiquitin-like protein Pup
MAEQERSRPQERAETETLDDTEAVEVDRELVDELDDLLDEIDTVLEENAEEFVRNYVQKGGE